MENKTETKQEIKEEKKTEAIAMSSTTETKQEVKEEKKTETKTEEKKTEKEKKKEEKKIVKDQAIVNGLNVGISTKHSMAICDMIKGMRIDQAMSDLEKVTRLKKAVKMKGEIPHRKGDMLGGRYPVKAAKEFIRMLKNLRANASVNGIEDPIITLAVPNKAARPFRRGGRTRFKRTNVLLIAKNFQANKERKK